MKIALLIYQYCNYETDTQASGGVERYVFDLSKMFVTLGHEVHIFCHKIKGAVNNNMIFHHVPALGFWSPLKIWTFAINSMIILKLKKSEFDVINSFSKTLFQDVLRLGGGSHFDYMKRTYPSMQNPFLKMLVIANPRHAFNLLLESVIFKLGMYKQLVCISQMCQKEYIKKFKIAEHKIRVIYNGVNTERFAPVNKKQSKENLYKQYLPHETKREEILILFAGSGFKRKGLIHIIKALSLLDDLSNIRLIVAGKGRIESYMATAKTLNVAKKVTYIGAVNNMRKLYDACDIFVFPTNYDAFGNVTLEAMAMELPVIVTASAGSSEVIENGITGFVVDYPIKAEAIANRIGKLMDEHKRVTMGKCARKKAKTFSLNLNAEKTLDLYNKITKKKHDT